MDKCVLLSKTGAKAVIIIGPDASEQERYAAGELSYYLGMMTAQTFDVSTRQDAAPAVYIGSAAQDMPPPRPLGDDGFFIRVDGDIRITGGRRGVIYGVYELLEQLGCRFFTATCEKIPTYDELAVEPYETCQLPTFEYREHNYWDLTAFPRFAVKRRLNGAHHPIKEKFGGYLSYAWYVHSHEAMVPPSIYAADHPEYYALYKGERVTLPERNQLCLTNPDVLRIGIESVRSRLRAAPQARIISISQNDWGGNCECERCARIDAEEGSAAGTALRFVNAIAEALEGEFPDVLFDTLAYQYTRPAPKITRPRHNVCVRLCTIECCFAHPMSSCDDERRGVRRPDGSRASLYSDLCDWGRVSDRTYIWDYTTCFAHYPAPHPNWRVLQPNIQAFARNGVKGVFEQANGAARGGTDLNELRAYIISKLLWDPDTDVVLHMREFTDYYYGAAAPHILDYINELCDKVECDNIHVGFNDNTNKPFLTADMLDIYQAHLEKARQAVIGDALRLYRVEKALLSPRYVRIKNKAMVDKELDAAEIRDFWADWQAFGLSRIDEWVSYQTTHRALIAGKWRGTEFYEHWTGEGGDEY